MKVLKYVLCVVVVGLAAGCQGVAGTWTADGSSEARSPVAQVSFCRDGTFTAVAAGLYGGGAPRMMSGHYTFQDGTIVFETEGVTREYGIEVSGDELTISYKGKAARMMRMRPRK